MAWLYERTERPDLCLAEGGEFEESQGGLIGVVQTLKWSLKTAVAEVEININHQNQMAVKYNATYFSLQGAR